MQIRALVFISATAVSTTLAILTLFAIFQFGPEIETFVRPILGFGWKGMPAVSDVVRDEQRVCFVLHIEKMHAATVRKYVFQAEPTLGTFIPVSAYLVDDRLQPIAPDLITHQVGERWARHYCFDLADRVPDGQPIRVSGHAEHTWQPFWTTITPTPVFVVPPLT